MDPVRPDYEGRCITRLVGALLGRHDWIPDPVRGAEAIVLLILDGLGAEIVQRSHLPTIRSLEGDAITSVVPSTTPTALTSISLGLPPAEHGVIGYRMFMGTGVLNVIRWKMQGKQTPEPSELQPREAFGGQPLPVVTRSAFKDTPFSGLHMRGTRFFGYQTTAALVERCRLLVEAGERFVYAYYDGPDVTAHIHGMRDGFFARELAFCDAMVDELLEVLPERAALVVTADHGHVHFDRRVDFAGQQAMIAVQSGESRFRYLHAKPGAAADLLEAVREVHSSHSWVFSQDELIGEGWLGPRAPSPVVRQRIGDVVVAAREPVGFLDPANPGEQRLVSGHGSLTPDEMLVPLLAGRGRA